MSTRKELTACVVALVLAASMAGSAMPASAQGCEDGGCWKVRFGINRTDGEDEILTIFDQPDGSEERTKLGVSAGNGPAVSLEYLFNERTGLEGSLCLTDLNALGVFDSANEWDMSTQDLGVTTLAIGPNFHLTPGRSYDFYVGVFAALAMFDDLDYTLLGRQLRADLDDETGLGAQIGIDVPFGASPWGFNLAARYMDVEADVAGDFPGSLSLSPVKAIAGLTWTSGGAKEPVEEPVAAPPPPPPPPAPVCGDGKVDPGEECDDGNNANGDGCSANCRKEPPPPAPAPPPPPPPQERKESCAFEFASDRVDNICKARLDEIGLSMVQDPSLVATVTGHSDSRGVDANNLRKSVERAEAVKKYLVDRYGIDPSRITTEGRGATEPVASNDTADGRQRNRRADVVVRSR